MSERIRRRDLPAIAVNFNLEVRGREIAITWRPFESSAVTSTVTSSMPARNTGCCAGGCGRLRVKRMQEADRNGCAERTARITAHLTLITMGS